MGYNPISHVPATRGLHVEDGEMTARKQIDADYLVREYLAGASELALSKALGVNRRAIRRCLIERGITPRTQSEAERIKWRLMPADKRRAQVTAAHAAVRGTRKSIESKIAHAKTVEAKQLHISPLERAFGWLLEDRGIVVTHQRAIGPYNCDLAAEPVAVEIFGGNWHFSGRHLARTPERFRYLMKAGWHVLAVVVSEDTPPQPLADYIARYIKRARRNPAARREYRVIRRGGQTLAAGGVDDDNVSIEWAFANRRNPTTGRYESIAR